MLDYPASYCNNKIHVKTPHTFTIHTRHQTKFITQARKQPGTQDEMGCPAALLLSRASHSPGPSGLRGSKTSSKAGRCWKKVWMHRVLCSRQALCSGVKSESGDPREHSDQGTTCLSSRTLDTAHELPWGKFSSPGPQGWEKSGSSHQRAQWKVSHSKPDHGAKYTFAPFFRKAIWQPVSITLKTFLPFDFVIPFLGIHTEKRIGDEDQDACPKVCAAELFITAKAWKQSKRSTPGKRLSKPCSARRMDYFAADENHVDKELMTWGDAPFRKGSEDALNTTAYAEWSQWHTTAQENKDNRRIQTTPAISRRGRRR